MRHHRSTTRDRIKTIIVTAGLVLAGCGAPVSPQQEPRYPEKKRPEPARSASDGEVLGAQRQSPEDTLEGSPTNEHAAPGWGGEEPAEADEDCAKPPATEAEAATAPASKKKRPCPPAEPR